MNTSRHTTRATRGSVLITAVVFAAVIAISLVSYLRLTNSSLSLANRSFYANSAMNVAEVGLEQTIARFNQLDNVSTPADAWPSAATVTPDSAGWRLNATAYDASTSPNTPWARNTFTGLKAGGPDTTASVEIYVHRYDGTTDDAPVVVAKSTITMLNARPIEKFIEVTLRKRALFANGMVAKYDVENAGTGFVARSWNSDPDNDKGAVTPAIAWDDALASTLGTADCTVASLLGDVDLGNGTVWGYAKTGPTGTIDASGTVRSLTDPADDPDRRTNDFSAYLPPVDVPTAVNPNNITSNITNSRIFGDPSSSDTRHTVGGVTTFYYVFDSSSNINLTGSHTLTMMGNCVFLMNNYSNGSPTTGTTTGGTAYNAVNVSGSQGVIINSGASLKIYTNANVILTGSASLNQNPQPITMQIYGTNPVLQTIDVGGTADVKTVIYAPNADIKLHGTLSVQGSIVGRSIDLMGTPEFIWDASLANHTVGNPYGISKWRELQSATERAQYSARLAY